MLCAYVVKSYNCLDAIAVHNRYDIGYTTWESRWNEAGYRINTKDADTFDEFNFKQLQLLLHYVTIN